MAGRMVRILDGNTFVVCDERGDVEASPTEPTGLFSFDTRFLSKWVLTIDGQKLNSLSIDDLQYFQSRFFLVPGTGTVYIDAKLSVIRERSVGDGFHEELTVLNHENEPVELTIRIDAASDFADLFEVKDALKKVGDYAARIEDGRLHLQYARETFKRETVISASAPASIDEGGLTFAVRVEPHGSWTTDLDVVTTRAGAGGTYATPKYQRGRKQARPNLEGGLERWIGDAPRLECDIGPLTATYRRSLVDLAALRFSPPVAGGKSLPAAGLPWFMTMFGRDSIFTSLQSLPFTPELAATTLRVLGDWQGSRRDDFRDEDPGRILHEMRYGEMAAFEERPHSPYYGSVDATPLYVVLLDEYERWTGDKKLVRDLEYEARAALNWIDEYADLMGNGYISYKRRNEQTGHREPVVEGFLELDLLQRRPAAELPAGDLRAPGIRLRRKAARRTAGPAGLERPGVRGPARRGGAGPQAALQPRLLAGRSRVFRDRPRRRRQPGRFARVEQRSPPVERHRRRLEGQVGGRPSDGAAAVLGLGGANAGRGRGPLQPDRLSPRDGLAVRQLVHRVGPAALRVQGGGGPHRARHPRRRGAVRRAAAGGLRRL